MNTLHTQGEVKQSVQATLSDKQRNLLLWLAKDQCARQVAGHSAAPWLSAGHALVRKGLAYTHRTGHFGLEEAGKKLAAQIRDAPVPSADSTPVASRENVKSVVALPTKEEE